MSIIEMVTITKAEYDALVEREKWLCYLEAAGVDNWSGWDDAMQLKCDDEELEND